MSKNPFDFSDVSDLPDDLAKRLHTDRTDHAKVFADVVSKGAAAGLTELDINQIMAAAIRMGIALPSQQAVRGYLNKAVDLGLIHKPTRQTYGAVADAVAKAKRTKAEDTGLTDDVVASDPLPDDPLAAL